MESRFPFPLRRATDGSPSRRAEPLRRGGPPTIRSSVAPLGAQCLAGLADSLVGGDSKDLDSPGEFCDDIGQLFILVHRSSLRDHGPVAAAALGDSHEIKISK